MRSYPRGMPIGQTPFDMNRQLQKAETPDEVYQMTATQIQKLMQRDILIYPVQSGVLSQGIIYPADGSRAYSVPDTDREQDVIRWVWQNRKRAGATTQNFPKAKRLYLAIRTGQQIYGVVGIPMEKQTQPDAFTSSVLFSILASALWRWKAYATPQKRKKPPSLQRTNSFVQTFCVQFPMTLGPR